MSMAQSTVMPHQQQRYQIPTPAQISRGNQSG